MPVESAGFQIAFSLGDGLRQGFFFDEIGKGFDGGADRCLDRLDRR